MFNMAGAGGVQSDKIYDPTAPINNTSNDVYTAGNKDLDTDAVVLVYRVRDTDANKKVNTL